jgi:hypothetical protein
LIAASIYAGLLLRELIQVPKILHKHQHAYLEIYSVNLTDCIGPCKMSRTQVVNQSQMLFSSTGQPDSMSYKA